MIDFKNYRRSVNQECISFSQSPPVPIPYTFSGIPPLRYYTFLITIYVSGNNYPTCQNTPLLFQPILTPRISISLTTPYPRISISLTAPYPRDAGTSQFRLCTDHATVMTPLRATSTAAFVRPAPSRCATPR